MRHRDQGIMKIAIVGPIYPLRGGVAQYTTLLCRELARRHQVLPVSFKRQYPGFLFPGKSNYEIDPPPFTGLHAEFIIDSLNPVTWRTAVRRILSFLPDMVIFQWWVTFWAPQFHYIACALRKSMPAPEIVFICHNVREHEPNRIKEFITKRVFSRADRFVTHCPQETDRLKEILPKAQVSTGFLPTYRDYCINAFPKSQAKIRLGLNGDVLLFFGFVRKYKGLNVLLEAMPLVLKKRTITLLVVGEFWKDKTPYLNRVQRLGLTEQVRVVDGYVSSEQAGLYFSAADLVVQPYLHASGSGVAQLAYGFNRPVIATQTGSLPDVVEDGINGRIVPPNNAQALAAAIVEALEPKKLESFSQQATRTREKFSWAKMADIILGLHRTA